MSAPTPKFAIYLLFTNTNKSFVKFEAQAWVKASKSYLYFDIMNFYAF